MANGKPGAPLGNKNGVKANIWTHAIERALKQRSALKRLGTIDDLAEKLIDLCLDGDLGALREFGDRIQGRSKQSIDITSEDVPISPELTYETARRLMFVLEQGARLNEKVNAGGSPGATQH